MLLSKIHRRLGKSPANSNQPILRNKRPQSREWRFISHRALSSSIRHSSGKSSRCAIRSRRKLQLLHSSLVRKPPLLALGSHRRQIAVTWTRRSKDEKRSNTSFDHIGCGEHAPTLLWNVQFVPLNILAKPCFW